MDDFRKQAVIENAGCCRFDDPHPRDRMQRRRARARFVIETRELIAEGLEEWS